MTLSTELDSAWTNDDGEPLGGWVVVSHDEYRRIVTDAGGYTELSVFSTLTDPDGVYGRPQIYTAWGRAVDDVPLVDIRDYVDEDKRQVFRRFVLEGTR